MELSYLPLNSSAKEIRLLTILPVSTRRGHSVYCTLSTHSLEDFKPEYSAFVESVRASSLSKRQTLSQWIDQRSSSTWRHLTPIQRVSRTRPPRYLHRFTWGDYAALSYVWGDERDTSQIVVNGIPTTVTKNLAHALKQFAKEAEFQDEFKLWVDALSINQADLEERARQVQGMREIYGKAWLVVAWLGEELNQSSSAIELVKDLASFRDAKLAEGLAETLTLEPRFLGKGCWLSLEEFMQRPYWYRL